MMVALGSICGISTNKILLLYDDDNTNKSLFYFIFLGVYDIDYNAEEGVARVRAVVDPNLLMKALAGSGPHAECIGFKLRHPRMNSSYSYNDSYYHRNGYNHGYINGPFNSPHYQPYYHGSDLPPPRYSSTEYDPYADERYNFCTIM